MMGQNSECTGTKTESAAKTQTKKRSRKTAIKSQPSKKSWIFRKHISQPSRYSGRIQELDPLEKYIFQSSRYCGRI